MADLTAEEEELNKAIKQTLPHHIKREMQIVNESTPIAELCRIYRALVQFIRTTHPTMTKNNEYLLRCLIISGISLSADICRRLIVELDATDLSPSDIPRLTRLRERPEAPVLHMFRATYGVKMPFLGGGSVIFKVSPEKSSSTKPTSSGSY